MTSTIATLATQAETRLKIASAGTGAEPSTAQMSDFLRLAFKDLIGVLPPILQTTLTVAGSNKAALTHNEAFYCAVNGLLLAGWEWGSEGQFIRVQPSAANRNDTLTVWYTAPITITTGSTTTVDTTCIFGNDWLEELAVIKAMLDASQRMSNVSASGGGDLHASWYRVLQDQYDRLFNAHNNRYGDWRQRMEADLVSRLQNGPEPRVESKHAGFRNRSGVRNWLTGAAPGEQ